MDKVYNPQNYEDEIYQKWEKSGFFNPDKCVTDGITDKNAPSYTIILPPPNITDKLHIGHSAMLAIEDLMIRYHRMKGYRTLWLPGTDHAAIATQNAVEKKLLKEQNLTRHDLGKEKFLKEVWKFLKETQAIILSQTRKMGASLDWSREAFTLDEQRKKAVIKMFIDMYNAGVIYKGERIVNWCPRCHSTLADDEVEYKEQKTNLYFFKYSKDFPFVIATTRPETKLGDTAVAVNPKDKRYKKYINKIYEINFCGILLKLKIIADHQVDMNFGTGALGVTPAHSMIDWQMAKENNLEIIKVINEDGKIQKGFNEFSNKNVIEAREMIVKKLKEQNLLEKEEEINNNLSICYRCNTPIEPLPSKQWFVAVDKKINFLNNKSLKEKAIEVAKDGKIKFIPERFLKRYLDWMENLHDWCISRQIWFGHQIPVWYRKQENKKTKIWELKICGENIFEAIKNGSKTIETRAGGDKETGKDRSQFKAGDVIKFFLADEKTDTIIKSIAPIEKTVKLTKHFKTIDQMFKAYEPNQVYPGKSVKEIKQWWTKYSALIKRIKQYGIWAIELSEVDEQEIYVGAKPLKGDDWVQDPDTLDTWFSSGMWTFSTLGWLNNFKNNKKSGDLAKFHPTQILETGYEILTLWVSRMIMMSLFAIQEIPFEKVYLHGMILDKKGKKMSKSKGNGIDPVDMIKKFGADAVRLSLLIGNTPGNDSRMSEEKIEGSRNFVNKFWNISRFITQTQNAKRKTQNKNAEINYKNLTLADKWILNKFNVLIKEVDNNLKKYNFSQAGEKLREFTWNYFADWYLEISKFEKNKEKNEILIYILENLLKLWHPFIPFVTEVIWQELNLSADKQKFLMIEKWPTYQIDKAIYSNANDFEVIKNIIIAIRNARSENKIEPSKKIKAIIYAGKNINLVEKNKELIKNLKTNINELEIKKSCDFKKTQDDKTIRIIVDDIEIYLIGAIDKEKEQKRINKKTLELEKLILNLEKKLSNKEFINKAPKQIVEKEKEKLKLFQTELKTRL
ncbi:MAG: class I tRNA ligase family protein [Candidatus Kuenenbacteria bacterium]